MSRMILALVLGLIIAAALVTYSDCGEPRAAVAEYVKPKMNVAPPAQINKGVAEDFLLLLEGDHVRVLFRAKAGAGSIRFLSLSAGSRLDIINPLAGAEKYVLRREQGWQTYPHAVAGQVVTVILRESGGGAIPEWDLPGCSDAVVRIDNALILSPHGAQVGAPLGARCPVCGAVLDW